MKVSKVTISGMHKVLNKTYELNPGTTYFIGANGAGKSTILEAIQLALLGYIPGYSKTKEGVMKHASMNYMEVTVELDSGITINRSWRKSGSGSVSSECNIQGYEGKIEDLLNGIELPVFDFNEFTSMTSNKLKEWFISFLPSATKSLNLSNLLKDELKDRQIPSDDLLKETEDWIKASDLKGIDLIKGLHTHLKEEQSFIKGQIAKLQGTIESLIYYDDAPDSDKDELNNQLLELNNVKTQILRSQAEHQSWDKMMAQIKLLEASLKSDSIESDERIAELEEKINKLSVEISQEQKAFDKIAKQCQDVESELIKVPSASATCPYTNKVCETAKGLTEQSEARRSALTEKLNALKDKKLQHNPASWHVKDQEIKQCQGEIARIKSQYMQLESLRDQAGPEPVIEDTRSVSEIDAEIAKIHQDLIKIAANERYDELTQTVTADKFAKENELEVLKVWIKFTDANGLQTTVMNEPFKDLSTDVSKYLTQMFGTETNAEFNLATKANSFSFGLTREDRYIEFDCLSSGERCLFTLALMMCILDRSNSQIRTILIDDLLDHLDGSNATSLFKSLLNVEDIQFILAGVKECEDQSICKPV